MEPQDNSLKKVMAGIPMSRDASQQGRAEKKQEMLDLLVFSLATSENFGVFVEHVEEVLSVPTIYPLPGVPDYILGVINWHLEIIAVLDLKTMFGLTDAVQGNRPRLLICRLEDMVIGFQVQRVVDVAAIPSHMVQEIPSEMRGEFLQGYIRAGELIALVNLEKLIKQAMKGI